MSNRRQGSKREEAARILGDLLPQYNRRFLQEDPVWHVHQYQDPQDQEIVAFISALLAFGNVKAIHGSVGQLLKVLGPGPRRYIEDFDPAREQEKFRKQGHRWVRGADLLLLMRVLKEILKRFGSLKGCFLKDYRESETDIGPILERFSTTVFSLVKDVGRNQPLSRGFRYFFPSPRDGSPCKRLNMFLRWMVRKPDGIDLGLWPEIPPSKLIIPLDVHVYRFAQRYRLSPYKTPRWEVASQVTEFLRELDSLDPVKYDFPICHHGMEVGW